MTEWQYLKCPVCGVLYGLDADFYQFRQRGGTHDGKPANWHCPNGHTLVVRESDLDKTRRERDRLQQQLAQRDDEIAAKTKQLSAARGQITKLGNRAKAGVCPCCQRSFSQLRRHMATKHPGFTAEVLQAS